MTVFYKVLAGVMVTIVLCLFLARNNKDYSILISMTACCLIIIAAATYLSPVLEFLGDIKRIADLDNDALQIVMNAVGVGILTDITSMICDDAGYAAMGKALKILSCAVILWLSIPLFESLLELLETILGNI